MNMLYRYVKSNALKIASKYTKMMRAIMTKIHAIISTAELLIISKCTAKLIKKTGTQINIHEFKKNLILITACLKSHLIVNEKDDVSFERIMNVPRRGIGEQSFNILKSEKNNKNLSYEDIKIYEYDGQLLADPSDPETYKWDLFYGPSENEGALGANLPNVFGVIKSSDVSKEIVSEKIYTYKNGLCVAGIEILCDDYILNYFYQGEEITGDFFYDLVMSSRFMKREKR